MIVTIKIPALWRPITHKSQVAVQACTVIDAVHELVTCFPKLDSQLLNSQKEVNDTIHLFVNGEAIRFRGGLTAPLQDGDEIYIVPMISGG